MLFVWNKIFCEKKLDQRTKCLFVFYGRLTFCIEISFTSGPISGVSIGMTHSHSGNDLFHHAICLFFGRIGFG